MSLISLSCGNIAQVPKAHAGNIPATEGIKNHYWSMMPVTICIISTVQLNQYDESVGKLLREWLTPWYCKTALRTSGVILVVGRCRIFFDPAVVDKPSFAVWISILSATILELSALPTWLFRFSGHAAMSGCPLMSHWLIGTFSELA